MTEKLRNPAAIALCRCAQKPGGAEHDDCKVEFFKVWCIPSVLCLVRSEKSAMTALVKLRYLEPLFVLGDNAEYGLLLFWCRAGGLKS